MKIINKFNGFTISEIMVSLLISSILIVGIVGVFQSHLISSDIQEAMVETSNRTHSAMNFISKDIENAGSEDLDDYEKQTFVWANTTNGDNDTLELTYENKTGEQKYSCGSTTASTTINNRYQVIDGLLYCNGVRLVGFVEKFKVFFVADVSGDGEPDKILTANDAESVADSPNMKIVGVKIFIIVSSPSPVTNFNLGYRFKIGSELFEAEDGKVYSYIMKHITLKNMI